MSVKKKKDSDNKKGKTGRKKLVFSKSWSFLWKYKKVIFSACLSTILSLFIMLYFFSRSYAISMVKNQFDVLEKDLQSIGYDFAYDNVDFYLFSPWQIMRAKNFRIYALDANNFKQINFEELNINVSPLNIEKIKIFTGSKVSLQEGSREYPVVIDDSDITIRIKNGEFKELYAIVKDINVKHLLSVNSILLQLRQDEHSSFAAIFDVKSIVLDDMTGWPLNKKIEHIQALASLYGSFDNDVTLGEAFYDWVDKGGYLAIHKGILNWKPLIMVTNGSVKFNEKAEANVSLNSASLALMETVEALSKNKLISNKGAFVVKLLLNNKAVKQNVSDKYETVISPIRINNEGLFLENIKLR